MIVIHPPITMNSTISYIQMFANMSNLTPEKTATHSTRVSLRRVSIRVLSSIGIS